MINPIIHQLRSDIISRYPERKDVIDGALCAVLAAEHVFLLGPPGTAKSSLARSIAQAFGGTYFERLLTKFSTPEELFGPISLKGLEQDKFVRLTSGKLPEAEIAFVDEVGKANSAILNSLLSLMIERTFANDGAPMTCPLITLFGASNELPDGKELEALFDRFLLRFDLQYLIQPASLRSILLAPDPAPSVSITLAELKKAQVDVLKVKVSDETVDALLAIRDACRVEGIIASDRRWKKCLRLVQASCYMAGEKKTTPEDLALLTDCLWREPKERAKIARLVGKLSDPAGTQATEILDAARETALKAADLKNGDRKAYITQAAQAVEQFNQQQVKLTELALAGGRRARGIVADASTEINAMHTELARAVSAGLGLRATR